MRSIDVSKTFRIWLGDTPEADYPAGDTLTRLVPVPAVPVIRHSRRITAEMRRQVCHGAYAYLGGSFEPSTSDTLRIEVVIEDRPGWPAPFALPASRHTRTGMDRQYAGAVIDAAADEYVDAGLGGGTLRFDRAAHDQVESNVFAFAVVTRTIIRLLAEDWNTASDDRLMELVRAVVARPHEHHLMGIRY